MRYSVIIPVYNRPDEVDELLQSLTVQHFKGFEVVVVEDGSSIPCKGVVDRYADQMCIRDRCRTTPEAPGVNLQASIDDRKDLTLSGQEIILQGNDSVLTSIPEIGYPYSVEFEIYADPKPNIDAVLFKGPHSVFTANWQNTGKFAFSRDGYEFIFHSYRLPDVYKRQVHLSP